MVEGKSLRSFRFFVFGEGNFAVEIIGTTNNLWLKNKNRWTTNHSRLKKKIIGTTNLHEFARMPFGISMVQRLFVSIRVIRG